MKNKIYWLILSFFAVILSVVQSYAQKKDITTSVSTDYTQVTSYNGATSQAFKLQVAITTKNINIPNWALMARVNGPIKNGEGKVIDPSKISIRINNISGDGPTIQQLGISNAPIPLSQVDRPIVQNSLWPLYTGPNQNYRQFLVSFDIIIAGGSYLEALKTYNAYNLSIVFSILSNTGALVSEASSTAGIQIYPAGLPPIDPTYSIQINGNASNGLLEFSSISDYVNGVSQTYTNGLSVISSTPYAVQVKTLTPTFESSSSGIPINTVSLNIKDPNSTLGGTISLSDNTQTVIGNAINNGTQARLFNIRYFTNPNDARLQSAKPDTYRATLIYTLIPQ